MAKKYSQYEAYQKEYNAYLKEQKRKKREPVMKVVRILIALAIVLLVGGGAYYGVTHPDAVSGAMKSVGSIIPKKEEKPDADVVVKVEFTNGDQDKEAMEEAAEEAEPPESSEPVPLEPVTLTAGEYSAGADFPAGRYVLSTEEDSCEFTKTGWVRWTLKRGDDGYTCTFEKGDELNCGGVITLTPVTDDAKEENKG